MERTISQEERIRRAEEIYNRRKYEERGNCYYKSKRQQSDDISKSVKAKLARKMIVQMFICIIIYAVIFTIQHSEQLFSQDIINKTKEILAYDISLDSLATYWNDAKLKLQNVQNGDGVKNESNGNDANLEENINSEENLNTEENNNLEDANFDQSQENINSEDSSEEGNTGQLNEQEAVGGAEEVAQVEEKTQEQLDIEYVKQNINIIWPLQGTITSRFGARTPTDIVTANHYGIDIAGNTGTTIVAAIDGTVTQNSTEGDYGYHLRIENGEVMTLYAHCSKLCVEEGTTVKQGEKIAEVGQTGRATGPHLHFEIRRQNRFINPEDILGTM